ncbi:MAG: ATP-dependent Clp protease proteolytic subunit [Acidobacteria bacterium]|nr:ATP-dependent Clp protease proteolytic subunit [Acidobacteriota bacterium]
MFASVDANTINALLNLIDQKLKSGVRKITLLISSPGGTVFHGLSAYNFLRGIPAEVVTHTLAALTQLGSSCIALEQSGYRFHTLDFSCMVLPQGFKTKGWKKSNWRSA